MKLKLFLFALCVIAFVATMAAQNVTIEGKTYSVKKPPKTETQIISESTFTGETFELNGAQVKVYRSKPTKKHPEGRLFWIGKTKDGLPSKKYLYEAGE